MALTLTKLSPNADHVESNYKRKYRKVVFDSSYPTGGESLTASDVGLRKILNVVAYGAINDQGAGDSTKTLHTRYDHTNSKLQTFWSAGSGAAPVEVTDTTDLSTYHCRIEALGY